VDALVEAVRAGGYLVPAGDYQAFADQVHGFLALPPDQRRARQEEAREYVRRGYSWEQTARQYLEMFAGD
jgi:glycosyltransferase involved in cell wall biosynthesis